MALTAEEEARLAKLKAEVGDDSSAEVFMPSVTSGLSPAEEERLSALKSEVSGDPLMPGVAGDIQAGIVGLAHGMSLGTSPKIKAGVRSLMGENYDTALSDEQELLRKIEKFHPQTYRATDFGGQLATTFGSGGLAKLGGGVVTQGAVLGGISGVGNAETGKELSGGILGALLGGVTAKAADAVGSVLKQAGPMYEKAAMGMFGKKAQKEAVVAAVKSAKDSIKVLDDAAKIETKLVDQYGKAFQKSIDNTLNDIAGKAKVSDTIAKEAVKRISSTEKLKNVFYPPKSIAEASRDMLSFQVGGIPGVFTTRAAQNFGGDIISGVGLGLKTLAPAAGAMVPNLYGEQ